MTIKDNEYISHFHQNESGTYILNFKFIYGARILSLFMVPEIYFITIISNRHSILTSNSCKLTNTLTIIHTG